MSTDIGSAPNASTIENEATAGRSPRLFLVVTGLIALIAASLPYIIGYYRTRSGVYLWAGTSPSDFGVYLAWMRAAADGSFRDPHLFAGGYPGMLINPVYWVMGLACRLTGLSETAVYHVSRIVCGGLLLYVLYGFVRFCTPDPLARRLAFLFLCFSSGFGWCLAWLPLKYWSIDRWQPEAFTFLSLYTYPHVCVALILQVAIVQLLLASLLTRSRRKAAYAGICGSLLSIIHTYDILSIGLVWLFYVFAPRLGDDRADLVPRRRIFSSTAVAALFTIPGFAFMYYQLHADRVFADRVAYPTPSFPPYTVIIGYGGILLLALIGAVLLNRSTSADDAVPRIRIFHREIGVVLIVWAVFNAVASYLPVSFQRKMLQGEHVPLCMLAALAAAWIFRRYMPRRDFGRLGCSEIALAALLAVGNVVYLDHDTREILAGIEQRQYRSTLRSGEVDALAWITRHTPSNSVVQPIPWVSFGPTGDPRSVDTTLELFSPGFTGRPEYVGHWDETPDCDTRNSDIMSLAFSRTPAVRQGLDEKSHVAYLIFSQKRDPSAVAAFTTANALAERQGGGGKSIVFRPVYKNADADVYAVTVGAK
jgi:hypothetical protein